MSTSTVVLLAVVVWLVVGITASYVMASRGHAASSWGALAAALGPFVVPLMVAATRREGSVMPRRLRAGGVGSGPVDVLVGVDGSEHARRALAEAVALLDGRLRRVTLATVLDYDALEAEEHAAYEVDARAWLDAAAAEHPALDVGTLLIAGPPATALAHLAAREGYELIVVGTRGRGLSAALLGSVAKRLVHQARVPVLVAGGADDVEQIPAPEPRSP